MVHILGDELNFLKIIYSFTITMFMRPWDKKTQDKGTTQVSGHFFKLHFCAFEKSQAKYNSFDCHNVFGIFSINCKVYMLNVWHKLKMVFIVQSIQTLRVVSHCFLQMSFFLPNVHCSFKKMERVLTLMIRREKGFEVMIFFLITHLSTFGSKIFLTLKIMDFENVIFTKIVHIYTIEGMNA